MPKNMKRSNSREYEVRIRVWASDSESAAEAASHLLNSGTEPDEVILVSIPRERWVHPTAGRFYTCTGIHKPFAVLDQCTDSRVAEFDTDGEAYEDARRRNSAVGNY